jgi:hypothetical protein
MCDDCPPDRRTDLPIDVVDERREPGVGWREIPGV